MFNGHPTDTSRYKTAQTGNLTTRTKKAKGISFDESPHLSDKSVTQPTIKEYLCLAQTDYHSINRLVIVVFINCIFSGNQTADSQEEKGVRQQTAGTTDRHTGLTDSQEDCQTVRQF